jgi:hypothetical protein
MGAITIPPTPYSLTSNGAAFQGANLNPKQRLAILVQAKIVLLNYKGGTNYLHNYNQLTIDAEAAFKGLSPDAWGAGSFQVDMDLDPGAYTVGQFVQAANNRDANHMPPDIATIMQLLTLASQMARPTLELQKQNVFLDVLLLGCWG